MSLRRFLVTQRWTGKLLGSFFGFLVAGSVGAFFGILIGNLFDRGLNEHFSRSHWHYHQEKRRHVQEIFFTTTFAIMGHIAKADGRISEQEIAIAKQIMDEMKLSTKERTLAKQCFNLGKKSDFNLSETLNELRQTCHDNPELIRLFIDIQYQAAAIEMLSDAKIKLLNTIFTEMGFAPIYRQYRFYDDFGDNLFGFAGRQSSHQHYSSQSQQRSHYQNQSTSNSSLNQAYTILGVSAQTSKADVKRAYRRLISKNHPDKLIAQGLPEAMIKIANNKTQQITKAYQHICSSKGW